MATHKKKTKKPQPRTKKPVKAKGKPSKVEAKKPGAAQAKKPTQADAKAGTARAKQPRKAEAKPRAQAKGKAAEPEVKTPGTAKGKRPEKAKAKRPEKAKGKQPEKAKVKVKVQAKGKAVETEAAQSEKAKGKPRAKAVQTETKKPRKARTKKPQEAKDESSEAATKPAVGKTKKRAPAEAEPRAEAEEAQTRPKRLRKKVRPKEGIEVEVAGGQPPSKGGRGRGRKSGGKEPKLELVSPEDGSAPVEDVSPAAEDADDEGLEDTESFLRGLVEAILFVSDRPLTVKEVARAIKVDKKRTQELIDELRERLRGRGIQLYEVAGGYAFRSSPTYADQVRHFLSHRPVRLSRAQLETLAIVAYRQPITRPDVDEVRGVDSGPVLKGLLERDLIKILGKKDEPGRPMLYGTTQAFLELFSMDSLQNLPTLKEFAELTDESKAVYESKLGEDAPDELDPALFSQAADAEAGGALPADSGSAGEAPPDVAGAEAAGDAPHDVVQSPSPDQGAAGEDGIEPEALVAEPSASDSASETSEMSDDEGGAFSVPPDASDADEDGAPVEGDAPDDQGDAFHQQDDAGDDDAGDDDDDDDDEDDDDDDDDDDED